MFLLIRSSSEHCLHPNYKNKVKEKDSRLDLVCRPLVSVPLLLIHRYYHRCLAGALLLGYASSLEIWSITLMTGVDHDTNQTIFSDHMLYYNTFLLFLFLFIFCVWGCMCFCSLWFIFVLFCFCFLLHWFVQTRM